MADVTLFDRFKRLAQSFAPEPKQEQKPEPTPEQKVEIALSGWLSTAPSEFWTWLDSEARIARQQAEIHIAIHPVAARWLGYETALRDLHARLRLWSGDER